MEGGLVPGISRNLAPGGGQELLITGKKWQQPDQFFLKNERKIGLFQNSPGKNLRGHPYIHAPSHPYTLVGCNRPKKTTTTCKHPAQIAAKPPLVPAKPPQKLSLLSLPCTSTISAALATKRSATRVASPLPVAPLDLPTPILPCCQSWCPWSSPYL